MRNLIRLVGALGALITATVFLALPAGASTTAHSGAPYTDNNYRHHHHHRMCVDIDPFTFNWTRFVTPDRDERHHSQCHVTESRGGWIVVDANGGITTGDMLVVGEVIRIHEPYVFPFTVTETVTGFNGSQALNTVTLSPKLPPELDGQILDYTVVTF